MRSKVVTLAVLLSASAVMSAQRGGSGAPNDNPLIVLTPGEQIADKLRIDEKQLATMNQLIGAGNTEGSAAQAETMTLRAKMAEAAAADKADEIGALVVQYRAATTKLTAIEVKTFQKLVASLETKQQSRAKDAVEWVPGLLQVKAPGISVPAPIMAEARRMQLRPPDPRVMKRLDLLEMIYTLTGPQKDQAKKIFDDAFKAAEPIRKQLEKTRLDLGAAVVANKPEADLIGLIALYGVPASQMCEAESKALGAFNKTLTKEQLANIGAGRNAVFLTRGSFLKKWNDIPDQRAY